MYHLHDTGCSGYRKGWSIYSCFAQKVLDVVTQHSGVLVAERWRSWVDPGFYVLRGIMKCAFVAGLTCNTLCKCLLSEKRFAGERYMFQLNQLLLPVCHFWRTLQNRQHFDSHQFVHIYGFWWNGYQALSRLLSSWTCDLHVTRQCRGFSAAGLQLQLQHSCLLHQLRNARNYLSFIASQDCKGTKFDRGRDHLTAKFFTLFSNVKDLYSNGTPIAFYALYFRKLWIYYRVQYNFYLIFPTSLGYTNAYILFDGNSYMFVFLWYDIIYTWPRWSMVPTSIWSFTAKA